MKTRNENIEILEPKNQLHLFSYENYFDYFIKLFEKEKMPRSILLSGLKGIGKSTFAYHFINYLLSMDEEKKYFVEDLFINKDNLSYKLLNNNTHPNFFLVENNVLEKDIKIDVIRNLLKFLNKSTYTKNLKLVLIDNAEHLNLNSSNALLKAIEEPPNNTFFFIINNSASKILNTIKSRCTEFRFFLTSSVKKNVFKNLIRQYKNDFENEKLLENFYFDTPGNFIKYFLALNKNSMQIQDNKLECVLFFIERYMIEKSLDTLSFLSLFVEIFYNELCLNNYNNHSRYFFNKSRILKQIHNMKKFNLNEKNVLIWIKDTVKNEER